MSTSKMGEWLHPATVLQAFVEGVNHNNYFKNVYTLTLCSAAPLSDEHVKKALTHLYRKVPTLRLCFKRRDGRLWACTMEKEYIDFEVVEGVEAEQVTEDLGCYPYNVTEGPMWCARLLSKEKDIINPRTELQTDFPYTRSLALANHHAEADGTTNTFTIEFFLQILNDVIAGKDIDDSQQMGEYKGYKELDELLNAKDKELEKDPETLEALLKEVKSVGDKEYPVSCKVLPPVHGVPYKTRLVQTVFDIDTTKRLIAKCKANGVTVNSGVMAMLFVTLVEYIKGTGLNLDEYKLSSAMAVSSRRFLPKNMANILGAHIGLLETTMKTPARWQDSFWSYAKEVHQGFTKGLLDAEPITFLCLERKAFYYDDGFQKFYSTPHPPAWDFVAATVGNLDTRIINEGEHVRMGHLVRFTTNAFEPLMHMYHTYRKRFHYSLSYSANMLTKETAQQILDLFVKILKSQI